MKKKVGKFVVIQFLDHSSHSATNRGALLLQVVGKIVAEDNKTYTVSPWHYADPQAEADHNCEEFTIIKSTIEDFKVLR